MEENKNLKKQAELNKTVLRWDEEILERFRNNSEKIPNVCIICGLRQGDCSEAHNDWLTFRDVYYESETAYRAAEVFGVSLEELFLRFMNVSVTKFEIVGDKNS